MPKLVLRVTMLALLLAARAHAVDETAWSEVQREVAATERAFAKSMADRDHAAFRSFLAEEAIFFAGSKALRGSEQIAAAWKPFYEKPEAPFAWEPDQVEVLDSGTLALSTGPVLDPAGKLVGRFNSIWRREAPGVWRIIFDKGSDVCPTAP